MKIKLILGLIITSLILQGCSEGQKVQKPQQELVAAINTEENIKDETKENEVVEEEKDVAQRDIEEQKEQIEQEEKEKKVEKKYIGETLDVMHRSGITKIYESADENSNVIRKLKDLEEVELLETIPYGWFKVKLTDGTIGYADARYIRTKEIPPHDYDQNVEGYVLIYTQDDQTLKIYKDGEMVLQSKGSAGLWDSFTPKGIFQIEKGRRGKWFYVERFKQGMKYWVGFKGVYLFHSLPFTKDVELIEEEAEKLGQPASHGCIRLPVDVAKYIYENVPEESLVLIY